MMQETLLLPRYAESLQAQRKAAFEQGIAALRMVVSNITDWFRTAWKAIVDAVRPAFQTLIDVLSRRGIIPRPQRTLLSKQSRRYLMVKRRELTRHKRHRRGR